MIRLINTFKDLVTTQNNFVLCVCRPLFHTVYEAKEAKQS